MLSIYDAETMERALNQPLDTPLRNLLTARFDHASTMGVTELTHWLVVQAGDTEADIVREIALSPLANPIDGKRYPSRRFRPFWDWLRDLGGWYEMIIAIGNGGFAFVLLIEAGEGADAALNSLCSLYAE